MTPDTIALLALMAQMGALQRELVEAKKAVKHG